MVTRENENCIPGVQNAVFSIISVDFVFIVPGTTGLDVQILNQALRRFVQLKSADYTLLMDFAKKFKVEAVLKNHLEVLL